MIYNNQVMRLARSITFKSIWSAFAMNQPLIELGQTVPDIKSEWRYFKHLNGEYLEGIDERVEIESLDTGETVVLTKDMLKNHKKTYTFYRDPENRENIHDRYPFMPLYIEGVFNPVPPEVTVPLEDGSIISYNKDLVEAQEATLILNIEKWIKAYHHQYVMESWNAAYNFSVADHIGRIYALLPGKIKELRLRAIHTSETHSYHITEFLRSHQNLHEYVPYLTIEQMLFLYRNIRYIERHAGKQDTFDFLVENLLTKRDIPLDKFLLAENYTEVKSGGLYKHPIGVKEPVNFKERSRGRDIDTLPIEEVIGKEYDAGKEHGRMIDEYIQTSGDLLIRSGTGSMPTKLLEVSGIDPSSFNSEKTLTRVINEWAYHSAKDLMRNNADVIDPQSGNSFRVTPLQSFALYLYAYYKGYHGLELKWIPIFNVVSTEEGVWYTKEEFTKGLITPHTLNLDTYIDFFNETTDGDTSVIYNRNDFYDRVTRRIAIKTRRERYLGSQRDDRTRREVEWLFNYTYRDHTLTHQLVNKDYTEFLYELGIDPRKYSDTMWRDLTKDLLKLTTDYDPDNVIGFDDIQSNLVGLFSKLSSYSIQFSTQFTSSDKLSTEPTVALVQHIGSESESKLQSFTESGLVVNAIELGAKVKVEGFDMLKTTAYDNAIQRVKVDTAIYANSVVNEEIFTRVIYDSSAIAKMVGGTDPEPGNTLASRIRIRSLGSFEFPLD